MSITIQLDLPEALANEARAKGLLQSECMTELISAELRRRAAAAELHKILNEIRSQPGEPMSMENIQAEVDTIRGERRARETGR